MTCGEKHALFWKKEGRCLVKKKGVFGRKANAQMLLCCSSLKGKVCAGGGSEWACAEHSTGGVETLTIFCNLSLAEDALKRAAVYTRKMLYFMVFYACPRFF